MNSVRIGLRHIPFSGVLRRPTLAKRIVLAMLLAAAAIWLVLIAFRGVEVLVEEDEVSGLPVLGQALVSALGAAEGPGEARAIVMSYERLLREQLSHGGMPGTGMLQLWDRRESRMLFSSAELGNAMLPGEAGRVVSAGTGAERFRVFKGESGRWLFLVAVPKLQPFLVFAMLAPEVAKYLLVALPFMLVPGGFAAVHGLRPLRQLSERIAARSADDLSPVGAAVRHAELVPLARALDALLEQLRGKVRREHAFVHDAAHEMRTPMAVVLAQAHVLAKSASAPERAEAAQRLEHAVERASRLVEQLLVLARIDSAPRPVSRKEVDAVGLASDAVAQFVPAALARGIDLSLQVPDGAVRMSDGFALQSVLLNLVDNAVRYGREGGAVEVSLRRGGGMIELSVADDGPGIAAADRDAVFDRFRRGAMNDAPGTGLGLAIVKQAVVHLGGAIELGPGLGGLGCRVTVRVPASG